MLKSSNGVKAIDSRIERLERVLLDEAVESENQKYNFSFLDELTRSISGDTIECNAELTEVHNFLCKALMMQHKPNKIEADENFISQLPKLLHFKSLLLLLQSLKIVTSITPSKKDKYFIPKIPGVNDFEQSLNEDDLIEISSLILPKYFKLRAQVLPKITIQPLSIEIDGAYFGGLNFVLDLTYQNRERELFALPLILDGLPKNHYAHICLSFSQLLNIETLSSSQIFTDYKKKILEIKEEKELKAKNLEIDAFFKKINNAIGSNRYKIYLPLKLAKDSKSVTHTIIKDYFPGFLGQAGELEIEVNREKKVVVFKFTPLKSYPYLVTYCEELPIISCEKLDDVERLIGKVEIVYGLIDPDSPQNTNTNMQDRFQTLTKDYVKHIFENIYKVGDSDNLLKISCENIILTYESNFNEFIEIVDTNSTGKHRRTKQLIQYFRKLTQILGFDDGDFPTYKFIHIIIKILRGEYMDVEKFLSDIKNSNPDYYEFILNVKLTVVEITRDTVYELLRNNPECAIKDTLDNFANLAGNGSFYAKSGIESPDETRQKYNKLHNLFSHLDRSSKEFMRYMSETLSLNFKDKRHLDSIAESNKTSHRFE